MKKIFLLLMLTGCMLCAFSQKKFKQFHVKYWTEGHDPAPLDFGSTTFGMRNGADATIDISFKDSTVKIASQGGTPYVYNIRSIAEEVKDKDRGYKYIKMTLADASGAEHLSFLKKYYKSTVVFELYSDRSNFIQYDCDSPKDY